MTRASAALRRCLDELRGRGLLPANALRLPTAVALAVREGFEFEDVAEHRDVVRVRLLYGRETLVHRVLWPDLLAVAISGAPWQTEWLPRKEAALLEHVEEEGVVVVDLALAERFDAAPKNFGKTLEARLLVLTRTAKGPGGMARELTSWWTWAEENGVAPNPDEDAARATIEARARALADGAFTPYLPWRPKPRPRGRTQKFG